MEITVCPRCQKPVEAKEYSSRNLWGSLNARIRCSKCKYVGLPIVLSDEE